MWKIIKWIWGLTAPFILAAELFVIALHFPSRFLHLESVIWAGPGFIGGIVLWLLLKEKLSFFSVFDHELTHLIAGLFFFYKPHSFEVHKHSGAVHLYGNNFLVTLAPYYFPTFTLFLMAFMPLVRVQFYPPYFLVLGLVDGYHVINKILSFRLIQTDLHQEGVVFSCLFTLTFFILFQGIFLYFLAGSWSGIVFFLTMIFHSIPIMFQRTLQILIMPAGLFR